MKQSTKSIALCAALFCAPSYANAGICAEGYITGMTEGGWNNNDVYVKVENVSGVESPSTWFGYMRFRTTLSEQRIESIRTLALLALSNGNRVEVRTATLNANGLDDCTNATELKAFWKTDSNS